MATIARARTHRWLVGAALTGVTVLATAVGQETTPKKVVPVPTTAAAPLPKTFISATGKFSGVVELKVLKAGTFADAGEQTATRAFFDLHVKGLADQEVIPAVGKLRQNLRTHLIAAGNAPQPAVHVWLRQYLFDELKKLVADDKQSLVTRVNALGMIGDLNQ